MRSGSNWGGGSLDEAFYGSASVGERGQIVIPAEAREELGFAPGDKLLVMKHPVHAGIMIFKLEAAQEFLGEFQATVAKLAKDIHDTEEEA